MAKWLGFGLLLFFSFGIYAQDLIVTSYNGSTTFSQYEEFSATVTIKNEGIVPITTSSSCHIYLSKDATAAYGDDFVGVGFVNKIGAGESLELQVKNGLACDVPAGNYFLIVIADYYGSVQETNEQNNPYVVGNVVVGAPDVDFQFTSLSVAPPADPPLDPSLPPYHRHETITISLEIVNTGTTNTGGFVYTNYYLSANNVLDNNDVLLVETRYDLEGTDRIAGPGGSWVIPSAVNPGEYYLIGKVDTDGDFNETDESNNTFASAPILIGESDIDLYFSDGTTAWFDDGTLTADFFLGNNGTTGAGGYRINPFLSVDAVLDETDVAFTVPNFDGSATPYMPPGSTGVHAHFYISGYSQSPPMPGTYYLILRVDGISETNLNNNVFISPAPIITVEPPPIPAISIVSAAFTGVYDNTDKNLELGITFTNTGDESSDVFDFDIKIKNSTGAVVYHTTYNDYLYLGPDQSAPSTWSFDLPTPLPHGAYTVEINSDEAGYAGSLFTVDLNIDIPTFAVRGTIQGEDGVPINQGKMFLYQKHDNGTVSFINHTVFTASNTYSFLTDYHQHTLFYIPDPKAYASYVPTIFGKTVTLKDQCFFSLTHDMDTVFEVLKVAPLASGKKTISGNVYTDASANGRKGSAAARISQLTNSEVEGFPVVLLSSTGIPVRVATTDSNGHYEFTGLPDDTYGIVVALELDKPVMQEPVPVDVTQRDAVVEFGLGEQEVQPVVKRLQEIIFQALPQKTFGDAPFTVSASASSALAVTLSSSDTKVAKVQNGKIEIVGAGRAMITASQEGTGEYIAATSVTHELVVAKASQPLTVAEIPEKTYGNPPFSLQVEASLNATVTITSSDRNIANVYQNKIYVVKPGTVNITIKAEGTTNFEAATVTRKLVINKQDQRITFDALPEVTMGDAPNLSLTANATSMLPVSFTSDNEAVATIDADNVLTIRGAGVANITAKQEGNDYFNAALAHRTLRVNIISGTEKQPKSFKAFPNPVAGQLTVEGTHPIKNITLTDASGHLVDNVSWTENTVDLHSLSPGVYLMKVESVNGTEVLRIVKR